MMTKKGHQLFWGKKCTPRENPGYAYDTEHRVSVILFCS